MNKRVNAHLAFIIILFLAVAVSAYTLFKSRSIDYEDNYEINSSLTKETEKQKENICETHAYKGLAEVNVWQTIKNGKIVLEVSGEDMAKMPQGAANNFQLVDPTPKLKAQLDSSSEKNPVRIKISGFATLCNGTSLASLAYEDGIFKPYIAN